MRNVVSYDDITEPPVAPSGPPSKKRKKNARQSNAQPPQDIEDDEMSRELTHQEIWDDSALIRAWDAANAEYEAYHGPDKGWKTKPVDSSPLWFNVPLNPSKKKQQQSDAHTEKGSQPAENSEPVNFDTFVPTHDASLIGRDEEETEQAQEYYDHEGYQYPAFPFGSLTDPASLASGVSQEEAFQRTMNAMYWTGYWSAMYHMKSQQNSQHDTNASSSGVEVIYENSVEEKLEEEMEEDDDLEDFIPSQR